MATDSKIVRTLITLRVGYHTVYALDTQPTKLRGGA